MYNRVVGPTKIVGIHLAEEHSILVLPGPNEVGGGSCGGGNSIPTPYPLDDLDKSGINTPLINS